MQIMSNHNINCELCTWFKLHLSICISAKASACNRMSKRKQSSTLLRFCHFNRMYHYQSIITNELNDHHAHL